jgi:hypothetical protein
MSQDARQRIGVTERLMRQSLGSGHPGYLLDDLFQALSGLDEIEKGQPPERAVPFYQSGFCSF